MSEVTDVALIILSFGFVAVCGLSGFVAWRTVRRVRRWRARLGQVVPQAIATSPPEALAAAWSQAHRTSLTARALVVTGPRRQALRLRRDLWTHISAAEMAVRAAGTAGTPVGQLPHLVAHLKDQARRHDHALVLVTKGVPVMDLDTARAETGRITAQADQVSGAVVDALRSDVTIDPEQLSVALDHETRAVSAASQLTR
ncbi:MAG: hypothetical protein ACLQOZ_15015 [Acidimicrobiales bacterium]|jgi:hypothetical protein